MVDSTLLELMIGIDSKLEAHVVFVESSTSLVPRFDCIPRIRSRVPLKIESPEEGNDHDHF